VVQPVERGHEPLIYTKYGKFIDWLAISPEEGVCSMDLLIIKASNSIKIGIAYFQTNEIRLLAAIVIVSSFVLYL
jgi:hypothetical protein